MDTPPRSTIVMTPRDTFSEFPTSLDNVARHRENGARLLAVDAASPRACRSASPSSQSRTTWRSSGSIRISHRTRHGTSRCSSSRPSAPCSSTTTRRSSPDGCRDSNAVPPRPMPPLCADHGGQGARHRGGASVGRGGTRLGGRRPAGPAQHAEPPGATACRPRERRGDRSPRKASSTAFSSIAPGSCASAGSTRSFSPCTTTPTSPCGFGRPAGSSGRSPGRWSPTGARGSSARATSPITCCGGRRPGTNAVATA